VALGSFLRGRAAVASLQHLMPVSSALTVDPPPRSPAAASGWQCLRLREVTAEGSARSGGYAVPATGATWQIGWCGVWAHWQGSDGSVADRWSFWQRAGCAVLQYGAQAAGWQTFNNECREVQLRCHRMGTQGAKQGAELGH
jgi:hypothetical protein